MSSVSLELDGEILHIKFNQAAQTPTIIRDTYDQLDEMVQENLLPGGPFIGVNGASTLLSGYAISQLLGQRYDTVAVFDPKLDGYIVVISSTELYQLGEVIPFKPDEHGTPLKIVLCGPPHVGKSCLREGLKQALMVHYQHKQSPYPYVLSACPDGEGAWFAATFKQSPELAEQLKEQYRAPFTPEFTQTMAQAITQLKIPLTLIDIGGDPSPENHQIVSGATHSIILWRHPLPNQKRPHSSLEDWQDFCQRTGLEVMAEIKSQIPPAPNPIQEDAPVLRGTIHGLKRGHDCSHHPITQALAKIIAQLSSS